MLLCYFLLLLCLTWGAVLWQSEQDQRSTESQIESINDNLAKAYEDHTQNALTRIEKVLAFLKADYEAHGAVTPSVHLMVKQQIDDPLINQSVVTDAVGNLLTSALDSRQNLAIAPQFKAHVQNDTGRFFIGQPRVGGISGKESVHISRRLNKLDGSFAGIVSVALNPQYFTKFYQSMWLSEGYTVCLFGLDGAIRARYPADATFNPQLLFAALEQQPAGNYREGDFFYSYRRLPSHPLGVLVGVSGGSRPRPRRTGQSPGIRHAGYLCRQRDYGRVFTQQPRPRRAGLATRREYPAGNNYARRQDAL